MYIVDMHGEQYMTYDIWMMIFWNVCHRTLIKQVVWEKKMKRQEKKMKIQEARMKSPLINKYF